MNGIVREIDRLGRVTIPKSLRKLLDLNERDEVMFKIDGNGLRLEKYNKRPVCAVTGKHTDDLFSYGNVILSKEGARQLREVMDNVLDQ